MASEIEPTESGHIQVGGDTIWWEYHGDGSREAVCLLNGLAMHTKAWYGILPLMIDDYDVLLYDFLGQGSSSQPDSPYSIPELARYLSLIMDHLSIEKIHVMGISYGGFIALECGRLFHERLHTLCLSGIFLEENVQFELYEAMSLRMYKSTEEVFDLYTHYLYEKIFGEPFLQACPPERFEEMRARFYDRYVAYRHSLIRLTEAQDPFFAAVPDLMDEYRAVTTPTLILAGSQDRAIPLWHQEKLLGIFPNSRMELIEGCGHVAYMESPNEFFGIMKRFMATKDVNFQVPEDLAGALVG
jgi:pimeloyl-ACP methyl ester carboxylesterase